MKSTLNALSFLLAFIVSANVANVSKSDDKTEKTQPASANDELTPEAQSIADELKSSLEAGSEAMAMLDDILQGSHLSADDGWFPLAKATSRYDWEFARQRYDADGDDQVQAKEFSGNEADFARLDRNGDQILDAADFDWSKHSLTPTPGFIMFFMADRDANGKLTREEFAGLYDMLQADEQDFLAIDDLREQFLPPDPSARDKRPDRPSRSTLVKQLRDQSIGALESGPKVGDTAPDFTLQELQGNAVTLTEEVGEKPIVLIFGNFTCGPFRSQSGNIEKLYERYRDRAKFFLVYVKEAHPRDGWWMQSNERVGIDLLQPKSNDERQSVAATCKSHLELTVPFLVDTVDDAVGSTYSGMPNRLYIVDRQGKIAFKNGRGPFGFHPRQLEQALVLLLTSEGQ